MRAECEGDESSAAAGHVKSENERRRACKRDASRGAGAEAGAVSTLERERKEGERRGRSAEAGAPDGVRKNDERIMREWGAELGGTGSAQRRPESGVRERDERETGRDYWIEWREGGESRDSRWTVSLCTVV